MSLTRPYSVPISGLVPQDAVGVMGAVEVGWDPGTTAADPAAPPRSGRSAGRRADPRADPGPRPTTTGDSGEWPPSGGTSPECPRPPTTGGPTPPSPTTTGPPTTGESTTPGTSPGPATTPGRTPGTTTPTSSPSPTPAKLKALKSIVEKATQGHKTFTIFGKFPSIREALKARGWVQNYDSHRLSRHHDDDMGVQSRLPAGAGENSQLISRLLRNTPVSLVWVMGDHVDWKSLGKNTLVSRFPRVYFTTKVGLCSYLQQSHWFCESGVSYPRFPRCYNISTAEDLNTFIRDFRLTACLSLLQFLVQSVDRDASHIFQQEGKIPLTVVEFAARRCSELVSCQEHEDIDRETAEKIWDHQWDQFLTHYYQLVQENTPFASATESQVEIIYSCSKLALESVKTYWPQLEMDGLNNLWIIKPAAKSRGRGIHVIRNLEDIIHKIGPLHPNDPRFVIQKYIERPLLIYNTKFDIRQWFLVTSAYPLTIWMYKESYLRFCSQLFSLTNMHESVHLSNNAVQCKYKNAKRDQSLPEENMWDCYTFQTYLRAMGLGDRWETVIYPGMRECITGTLLAAQEHMEHRRNCFELYGADFILTEDLQPWLIEINSSPCMSPTTSVTARMCSQCLEDVIKVVIDKRNDKDADTGMFEMVYKQQVSNPQPYMGMNLTVRGNRIGKSSRGNAKSNYLAEAERGVARSPMFREAVSRLSSELSPRSEEERPRGRQEEGAASTGSSAGEAADRKQDPARTKAKRRHYKKHSCVNRSTSLVQFRYGRQFNSITKRMRLQAGYNCLRRLDIPQGSELSDWRLRVEETRASCEEILSKLKQKEKTAAGKAGRGEEGAGQAEKLPRVGEGQGQVGPPQVAASPKKEKNPLNLPEIKIGMFKDANNNVHNSSLVNTYYALPEEKYNFVDKVTKIPSSKLLK